MFQLKEKLDFSAGLCAGTSMKFQKLGKTHDRKFAIVAAIAKWPAFACAQGPKLDPGEVFDKPTFELHAIDASAGAPFGELGVIGDIGREREFRIMPANQYAVARGNKIGFDCIRPHFNGQFECGKRVLRPISARAAVSDD